MPTTSNSCRATSSAVFRPVSTLTLSQKRVGRRLGTSPRKIHLWLQAKLHRTIHLTRVSFTGTLSSQDLTRRNRVLSQFWPSSYLSQTSFLTTRVPASNQSSKKSNFKALTRPILQPHKPKVGPKKWLSSMHARSKDLTRGTQDSTQLLSKPKRRRLRKKSL